MSEDPYFAQTRRLFKRQNNSFFDLERDHLVCGAEVAVAPFS